jgi:hypothetical protein
MGAEQSSFEFAELVTPASPRSATLQQRFEAFHLANPWVLAELERMTAELAAAGRTRIGVKMLFEVIRWQHDRSTSGSEFKLNNNYTARYVRLMLGRHPEWAHMFELRELKAA